MENAIVSRVHEMLITMGLNPSAAGWLDQLIILAIILLLGVIMELCNRFVIIPAIQHMVKATKATWDDDLFSKNLLRKLLTPLSLMLVYMLLPLAFDAHGDTLMIIKRICMVVLVILLAGFVNALLKTIFDLIGRHESMHGKPMRGVLQILQITLYVVSTIIVISIILQKSPTALLTGLGASAALMMLIFKDTISGLVSGVQLSANNMLKPGDWITMPKYGADGTVLEVTLNTVKVRNFDNTITTIPPYALTNDSFQNWRGMEESPGRRIKRSINIDMNSVKFCTPEMLDKYRSVALLTKYIEDKEAELANWNHDLNLDSSVRINARRQTNIGVFRAYLDRYLANLPSVNKDMTCMVRQLQPTENGIPIELYFFSAIKEWIPYERVQADVFDHVLSVIPEFDLHVFQNPSGSDFRSLGKI